VNPVDNDLTCVNAGFFIQNQQTQLEQQQQQQQMPGCICE